LNEEPLLNSGFVGGRHACLVKRGLPRKTGSFPYTTVICYAGFIE